MAEDVDLRCNVGFCVLVLLMEDLSEKCFFCRFASL